MRKAKRKVEALAPTAEQQRDGAFAVLDIVDRRAGASISIGRAYRRVPMIDRLRDEGLLSRDEHKALKHYRHHADMIDRSPTRDSLDTRRGGGEGPAFSIVNAAYVVRQIESAVGSLVDILRAVVVDDSSLAQWAINRHGGIERRRIRVRYRKGKPVEFIETRIEPSERALGIVRLEMKIAASRVASEMAA